MNYLTLGTLWKDEDDVCLEFIDYHLNAIKGVDKILIFDREYHRIKKLVGDNPKVEVVHYPESSHNVHAQAWADMVARCKGQTKWLACIDGDQALVPIKTNNMVDVLRDYESFGALQINWSTFTSNKHQTKVPGSLYERFTESALEDEGVNAHCQFIVQVDSANPVKGCDPHTPTLLPGHISVNTRKSQVIGPFSKPIDHSVIYVAHYINKSREEYLAKRAKGRADIYGQLMPDMFHVHEFANVKQDTRVKDLWDSRSK